MKRKRSQRKKKNYEKNESQQNENKNFEDTILQGFFLIGNIPKKNKIKEPTTPFKQ